MALVIYLCDETFYRMKTYEPLKARYIEIVGERINMMVEIELEWRGSFKDENGKFANSMKNITKTDGIYVPFSKVSYPAVLILHHRFWKN